MDTEKIIADLSKKYKGCLIYEGEPGMIVIEETSKNPKYIRVAEYKIAKCKSKAQEYQDRFLNEILDVFRKNPDDKFTGKNR